MDADAYLGLSVLFVLASVLTAALALMSRSRLRFVAPFTVLLSVAVVYFSFDAFLGTAKPIGTNPFWNLPAMGNDGAVVVGGRIRGPHDVFLLLEQGNLPPVLYWFAPTEKQMGDLKRAMETHGKAHGGKEWGFKMKGGSGDKTGSIPGSGDSLEDRVSTYKFEQPVAPAMPAKNVP